MPCCDVTSILLYQQDSQWIRKLSWLGVFDEHHVTIISCVCPKKKLDKKALLKKKEEERLRQEELARQEQERIRLLEEEERLRKEEEARIKAEEDQKRGEQEAEISDYIRRVFSLSSHKRVKDWEQKRWNDYIHKTKEMDSLKLPIVNAFISEWEDDPSYEIESVVQTSHRCLQ
ncbi:hypothetical protein AVEN_122196-1, partial [Araneus ventricosus]